MQEGIDKFPHPIKSEIKDFKIHNDANIHMTFSWRISDPELFSESVSSEEILIDRCKRDMAQFVKDIKQDQIYGQCQEISTLMQLWFDSRYDNYREKLGVVLVDLKTRPC